MYKSSKLIKEEDNYTVHVVDALYLSIAESICRTETESGNCSVVFLKEESQQKQNWNTASDSRSTVLSPMVVAYGPEATGYVDSSIDQFLYNNTMFAF